MAKLQSKVILLLMAIQPFAGKGAFACALLMTGIVMTVNPHPPMIMPVAQISGTIPASQSVVNAIISSKLDEISAKEKSLEEDNKEIKRTLADMDNQHYFLRGAILGFGSIITILLGIQTLFKRKE